jgi:hypothetical protein
VTADQTFPGATGVTLLDVYDWPTADGLRAARVLRVPRPAGPRRYGMCGRLTPYPAAPLARD